MQSKSRKGLELENPKRTPSASAYEPFLEAIELGLSRVRDATAIWQDLVRRVRKLRGNQPLQARAVILTGPGEDYGECRVMVRNTLEGSSDQQQIGGRERQRFP